MKELFLKEKPVEALTSIRKTREDIYASAISRKIDTTYAHTVKIVSRLEEQDLIETDKQGRKKIITLTEKGEKFADSLIELLNCVEEQSSTNRDAQKLYEP